MSATWETLPRDATGMWVVVTEAEVVFLDLSTGHSLRLATTRDEPSWTRGPWRDTDGAWQPLVRAVADGGLDPVSVGQRMMWSADHDFFTDRWFVTTAPVVTIAPAREHVLGAVVDRLPRDGTGRLWVASGWWRLVAATHQRLAEVDPGYRLASASEKFGLLRYSVVPPHDREVASVMRDIIAEARERSGSICEACGQPGSVRTHAPVRTVCAKHGDWF